MLGFSLYANNSSMLLWSAAAAFVAVLAFFVARLALISSIAEWTSIRLCTN